MPLDLSRRGFLSGLGAALITAPAIVRATSLMPVKALEQDIGLEALIDPGNTYPEDATLEKLIAVTRRAFVPRLYVHLHEFRFGGIDA